MNPAALLQPRQSFDLQDVARRRVAAAEAQVAQQQLKDEQQLRDAAKRFRTPEELVAFIGQSNPRAAIALQTSLAAQRKAQEDADKAAAEAKLKGFEAGDQEALRGIGANANGKYSTIAAELDRLNPQMGIKFRQDNAALIEAENKARSTGVAANVAEGTEADQIARIQAEAAKAGADSRVAVGTETPRIAQAGSDAERAAQEALISGSNARVATTTEPGRIAAGPDATGLTADQRRQQEQALADDKRADAAAAEAVRHNKAIEAHNAATRDTQTADQKNFEAAKRDGFNGSFMDWMRERNPRSSTGAERQTLAYFNRAKQAVENVVDTGLEGRMAKLGLFDEARLQYAPNLLQSSEMQQYRQAQRAFTEARLRKESGAAIPDSEFANDSMIYWRRAGDSDEVAAQKAAARQTVLDGLKFSAGRAVQEFYGEGEPGPKSSTAPAPPKAGDVVDGYVFLGGNPADKSRWKKK